MAHSASSALVSTSDPRAVLIRVAWSFMARSSGAPIMCRVSGSAGAWTVTMSDAGRSSSSGTSRPPAASTASGSACGSLTRTGDVLQLLDQLDHAASDPGEPDHTDDPADVAELTTLRGVAPVVPVGAGIVGQDVGLLPRQDDGGEGELGHGDGVGIRAVGDQDAAFPQLVADEAAHGAGAVEHCAQVGHPLQPFASRAEERPSWSAGSPRPPGARRVPGNPVNPSTACRPGQRVLPAAAVGWNQIDRQRFRYS